MIFYLISALAVIGVAFVVFRIFVRRSYEQRGQLTLTSGMLELFVFVLYMSFPYTYNPPEWPWSHDPSISSTQAAVGWAIIAAGACIAFPAMAWLGFRRSLGQDATQLNQSGFYRFTRNPQIVGGVFLVVGSSALWPSWFAVGWIALYASIGHMMVLTEEEHLRRRYGGEYGQYCTRVPRYVGVPHAERRSQ